MARINFMKLIIASPSEETAKIICFESDLNVITSNRKKAMILVNRSSLKVYITAWAQTANLMTSST